MLEGLLMFLGGIVFFIGVIILIGFTVGVIVILRVCNKLQITRRMKAVWQRLRWYISGRGFGL